MLSFPHHLTSAINYQIAPSWANISWKISVVDILGLWFPTCGLVGVLERAPNIKYISLFISFLCVVQ